MSIDDDAYFELMMNNAWRMNTNTTYNNEKKGWSNKDNKKNTKLSEQYNKKCKSGKKPQKEEEEITTSKKENSTIEKFRNILHNRGERGIIGLARQFKIFDDNNNKTLEYAEFVKAT